MCFATAAWRPCGAPRTAGAPDAHNHACTLRPRSLGNPHNLTMHARLRLSAGFAHAELSVEEVCDLKAASRRMKQRATQKQCVRGACCRARGRRCLSLWHATLVGSVCRAWRAPPPDSARAAAAVCRVLARAARRRGSPWMWRRGRALHSVSSAPAVAAVQGLCAAAQCGVLLLPLASLTGARAPAPLTPPNHTRRVVVRRNANAHPRASAARQLSADDHRS